MNISETSGPIAIIFYLKHHWVGGKAALGFGSGRIRTLVSMATDRSHRVIMGKTVLPLFLGCFSSDLFSYLQVTMIYIRAQRSSNSGRIRHFTLELFALEHSH